VTDSDGRHRIVLASRRRPASASLAMTLSRCEPAASPEHSPYGVPAIRVAARSERSKIAREVHLAAGALLQSLMR
jgi:hypothetical protein